MTMIYGKIGNGPSQITLHNTAQLQPTSAYTHERSITHEQSFIGVQWTDTFARDLFVHETPDTVLLCHGFLSHLDELRQSLDCDTLLPTAELLFKAYHRFGNTTALHVEGMYQLLVWEKNSNTFTIFQTPFTTFQFMYGIHHGTLYFSNYFPVIKKLLPCSLTLNEKKIVEKAVFYELDAETSVYNEFRHVPGGYFFTYTPRDAKTQRFWCPDDEMGKGDKLTREETIDYANHLVSTQIKKILAHYGDIVGSECSGGLDSSYITAHAARLRAAEGKRLATYTIVPNAIEAAFPCRTNKYHDDRPFVDAIAAFHPNIDTHYMTDEHRFCSLLDIAYYSANYIGTPERNSGIFSGYMGMYRESAAQGHRVLLNGRLGNATLSWKGNKHSLYETARHIKHQLEYLWQRFTGKTLTSFSFIRLEKIKEHRPRLSPLLSGLQKHSRQTVLKAALPEYYETGKMLSMAQVFFDQRQADPLLQYQLMRLTLNTPENYFSRNNTHRALARDAGHTLLPHAIRNNTKIGYQNPGWFYQLQEECRTNDEKITQTMKHPRLNALFNTTTMLIAMKNIVSAPVSLSNVSLKTLEARTLLINLQLILFIRYQEVAGGKLSFDNPPEPA